jgi:hypothetical protein
MALHANQRMQAINFFLLTTAFITAGFGGALNAHEPEVAAGIGFFGAVISVLFWRLEERIKQLLHIGEDAMLPLENRLAQLAGEGNLTFVDRSNTHKIQGKGGVLVSYGSIIPSIQAVIFVAFVSAGIFGVVQALDDKRDAKPASHCIQIRRSGIQILNSPCPR